jgi:hypothetical protein
VSPGGSGYVKDLGQIFEIDRKNQEFLRKRPHFKILATPVLSTGYCFTFITFKYIVVIFKGFSSLLSHPVKEKYPKVGCVGAHKIVIYKTRHLKYDTNNKQYENRSYILSEFSDQTCSFIVPDEGPSLVQKFVQTDDIQSMTPTQKKFIPDILKQLCSLII